MKLLNWLRQKINRELNLFPQRKLYRFCENLYLKSIVKEDFKRLPSSLIGHCPLITKSHFYKIAYKNTEFFKHERDSIEFLNQKYPEITRVIPNYIYNKNHFKAEILEPISNIEEQMDIAKNILSKFAQHGHYQKIELDKMPHIIDGLNIIKYLLGDNVYLKTKKRVENIFKNNEFRIGISHGDFHSKNLIKNYQQAFVIDFDCFRKNSIQEFDAIYFLIQYIVDIDGNIWWHEALIDFDNKLEQHKEYKNFLNEYVDLNKIEDLKLLYFLDRIGQDEKYSKNFDTLPRRSIIKIAEELVLAPIS